MLIGLILTRHAHLTVLLFLVIVFSLASEISLIDAQVSKLEQAKGVNQTGIAFEHPLPVLKDPRLKVEIVADGLTVPTGIWFLDKDNILVLQRYTSGFALGGLTTVNQIIN